jgi:hypothetical protein
VRFILASVLFLTLTSAEARDVDTGNFFLPWCQKAISNPVDFASGVCMGIVRATSIMGRTIEGPLHLCVPDEATNGQMLRIVVRYLDEHPEELHLPFQILAWRALSGAWPCSK